MKTKQSNDSVVSAENETSHSGYARLADAREIKFRAWNIPNAQMYFDVQNGVLAENEKKQLVLGVSLGRLLKDAGSVIMQFTGFKDKNGKEIYEGDILSDWTETDEGMMQSFQTVFFETSVGQWAIDYGFNQNRESWFALFDELNKNKLHL